MGIIKRKMEWSFFLSDWNRITYNELCRRCCHSCKQSFRAVVVECPRYLSKRAIKPASENEAGIRENEIAVSREMTDVLFTQEQGYRGQRPMCRLRAAAIAQLSDECVA